MWFFAVLVVGVLGVVAVVATGWGDPLSEVYDDRPDARLPAAGPLTARDLQQVRFTTAFRGYRTVEVDALVDRLVAELAAAEERARQVPPADQPDPDA